MSELQNVFERDRMDAIIFNRIIFLNYVIHIDIDSHIASPILILHSDHDDN